MTGSSVTASGTTASSTRTGPAPRSPRTAEACTTEAHAVSPAPDATTPCAAPCTTSYHRLDTLAPVLRVRCAPPRRGRGWIPAADLAARPEAVRDLIAHDARQGLARYGRPLRPDVAAGFGLHRFVWPVALLFTVPWFLERRVPLLSAEDVALRRRTGEVTVRPGAFACLPDDPAARLPQARTVPDEAALAAELRSALSEFLAPALAAFRPEVRRGPRVLWAMATDAAVEGLWYVGGLLGEEERVQAELSALLEPAAPAYAPGVADAPAPAPAPFTPGAGFTATAVGRGGASGTDRARASCCLVYTAEPADMCGGCPRVTRS
ncbi:(2Fe-2S)-binding protein [Kitasatospora aureofaciens]|uniref:(2Fe-2S)-binding protein n=1 Tax=Kitasatospora aureofaciens TaxID=1894 RepID=UPI001C43FC55|nr:(2Fe-2S)-binding protein [Kitasatospora aureofaciens]MBV6700681.1 (2Fe-2S)-binding protein [Kitasatospora aureofaciens]